MKIFVVLCSWVVLCCCVVVAGHNQLVCMQEANEEPPKPLPVIPEEEPEPDAVSRMEASQALIKATKLPDLSEIKVVSSRYDLHDVRILRDAIGRIQGLSNENDPVLAPRLSATVISVRPYVFQANPNLVGALVLVRAIRAPVDQEWQEDSYFSVEMPREWTFISSHVQTATTECQGHNYRPLGIHNRAGVCINPTRSLGQLDIKKNWWKDVLFIFARADDLRQLRPVR